MRPEAPPGGTWYGRCRTGPSRLPSRSRPPYQYQLPNRFRCRSFRFPNRSPPRRLTDRWDIRGPRIPALHPPQRVPHPPRSLKPSSVSWFLLRWAVGRIGVPLSFWAPVRVRPRGIQFQSKNQQLLPHRFPNRYPRRPFQHRHCRFQDRDQRRLHDSMKFRSVSRCIWAFSPRGCRRW
jgi:hypothetical protein